MDSRVIFNRMKDRYALTSAECRSLKRMRPTLNAASPVEKTARISVVIPTFFNEQLKQGSLRHVLAGLSQSEAVQEVILVSSEGIDQPWTELQSLLGDCPLKVVPAEPANRGQSRNVGAAKASYEFLLFLDDDMLLKNWRCVDVLLSEMLTKSYDCALFPRRHYLPFPTIYDPGVLEASIQSWREDSAASSSVILDPLDSRVMELPSLFCFPGCFMLIGRETYHRLGGFSQKFQGWGYEDTSFGVTALRQLRVLNLFSLAEPLLHLDHPVSPYKSIEHHENMRRFVTSNSFMEVNRFCRLVLLPEKEGETRARSVSSVLTRPGEPAQAMALQGIPVETKAVTRWLSGVARQRTRQILPPWPEFIVLHGSRATGRAHQESDFDVLAIYRGAVQDFYVTGTNPRVEIECAEIGVFEAALATPWLYGLNGVLELAKIAQATLLWGDKRQWKSWRAKAMRRAVKNGALYWRLLTLGLHAHASKYGKMLPRYEGAMRAVLSAAKAGSHDEIWTPFVLEEYRRQTVLLLDQQRPTWRRRVAEGKLVFPLQIPEVWSALYGLAEKKQPPKPSLKSELCLTARTPSTLSPALTL